MTRMTPLFASKSNLANINTTAVFPSSPAVTSVLHAHCPHTSTTNPRPTAARLAVSAAQAIPTALFGRLGSSFPVLTVCVIAAELVISPTEGVYRVVD
jgi:hypothetical protein